MNFKYGFYIGKHGMATGGHRIEDHFVDITDMVGGGVRSNFRFKI